MLNKNLHHCLCSYKIVVIKEKECNIRQTIDKNMPFMQTNMLMYEQTFFFFHVYYQGCSNMCNYLVDFKIFKISFKEKKNPSSFLITFAKISLVRQYNL